VETSETSAVASAARSWTDICASTVEAISGQLSISRHFCRHCDESLTLTRSRASVRSTINILRDCATSIRISCAKLHKIQSRGATQSISVVPVIEAILRQVLSAVFFLGPTRTHEVAHLILFIDPHSKEQRDEHDDCTACSICSSRKHSHFRIRTPFSPLQCKKALVWTDGHAFQLACCNRAVFNFSVSERRGM